MLTTAPGESSFVVTKFSTTGLPSIVVDRVTFRTNVLTVLVDDTAAPNIISCRPSPYIFLTLVLVTIVVVTSL